MLDSSTAAHRRLIWKAVEQQYSNVQSKEERTRTYGVVVFKRCSCFVVAGASIYMEIVLVSNDISEILDSEWDDTCLSFKPAAAAYGSVLKRNCVSSFLVSRFVAVRVCGSILIGIGLTLVVCCLLGGVHLSLTWLHYPTLVYQSSVSLRQCRAASKCLCLTFR